MCGRFAMLVRPAEMPTLFDVAEVEDFPPRHNVAPTQPILVVVVEHGMRMAKLMRWGLVPGWVKDPRAFSLLINARGETMADKPAFRDSLKHGRCIIPASGYFEWRTGPDKRKQPYYITLANDAPMLLAGLCTSWSGPNGEEVDTAATITVAANDALSVIHDRMPAILLPEQMNDWLDVKAIRADEAVRLIRPLPNGAVKFHPVSAMVNSARFDDANLILPVRLEEERAVVAAKAKKAVPESNQLDLF
jgi:putative SOS response-associated peptidase YedK